MLLLQQPERTKTSMTASVFKMTILIFSLHLSKLSPKCSFSYELQAETHLLITESTPVSASLPILAAFLLVTMFYVHVPRSTFLHIPCTQFPLTFSETPLLRDTFSLVQYFLPLHWITPIRLKTYLSIPMFKNSTSTPYMPFLSSS